MINDPYVGQEKARAMDEPVIAFDTSNGSSTGRFFLMECREGGCMPTQLPERVRTEMTRKCFNRMRAMGMLITDLEHRVRMHDRCQAWRVRKE